MQFNLVILLPTNLKRALGIRCLVLSKHRLSVVDVLVVDYVHVFIVVVAVVILCILLFLEFGNKLVEFIKSIVCHVDTYSWLFDCQKFCKSHLIIALIDNLHSEIFLFLA